jgi:hypothetical protein
VQIAILSHLAVMNKFLLSIILIMVGVCPKVYATGQLVTESRVDIFGNGARERVRLLLVEGKKYHDQELWCGSGWKYEGVFSISVIFPDGRHAETKVNSFWDNEKLFFYSKPWTIRFADYNHDGVLDINIGQYAGCNGSGYKIFSFTKDGKVFLLPVMRYKAIPLSGHDNSSGNITLTASGFSAGYYNNTIGGNTTVFYDWDPLSRLFVPNREVDEFNNFEDNIKSCTKVIRLLDRMSGEYKEISRENYHP